MSARQAVAAIAAALTLVACGQAPTPAPATPGPTASAAPSASPDVVLGPDDAAYLLGDVFTLPVGDAGADWTAPAATPNMPNGHRPVRVAFLPASCAVGQFTITTDAAPKDDWETQLQTDGDRQHYMFGSWPAAQLPECAAGQGRTYLQVAYHPFTAHGTIRLVAALTNVTNAPATIDVIPVFTSADASQPSFTMNGSTSLGPIKGAEKARSTKAQLLSAVEFTAATLPDGTSPTAWGYIVTGCGPVRGKPIVITVRIGDAAPVNVGTCADGGSLSYRTPMPLPAAGTKVTLLIAGGTTKSQVRVSEFQWRGDRN